MTATRTRAALGLAVATLAAGNVVRSVVLPDAADLPFNLAMAVALVLITTRVAGTTGDELGLSPDHVGHGVRLGAIAFGAISAVVVAAAIVPATRGFFDDDRVDVGIGDWLFDVVVDIPFGTIVLEEVAFRGCILALLLRLLAVRRAVAVASVLFGVWHIAPAWTSARDNATLDDVAQNVSGLFGIVGGTVVVTTIAGAVFAWLRLRSGSLLAPMMAHYATNAVAFTAGWIIAR